MTSYPSLHQKVKHYSGVIKEEHRKPKSDRRPDLKQIITKKCTIERWIKQLDA